MNPKTIVSSSVLLASLLSYWYARSQQKDVVPYMLIGGFIGSILGESIAHKQQVNKSA